MAKGPEKPKPLVFRVACSRCGNYYDLSADEVSQVRGDKGNFVRLPLDLACVPCLFEHGEIEVAGIRIIRL